MPLLSRFKRLGGVLLVYVLLSGAAMARHWPWRHLKASSAAQTHDDSGRKKSDQDSPAQGQAAPEQPAPDEDKSEAKPPSQDKAAKAQEQQESPKPENSKHNESRENTKENGQPAAEPSPAGAEANAPTSGEASPAQAGPASESAQTESSPGTNAPQTGTPETPPSGSAVETAPAPTEKSNPSAAAKFSNHTHKSANRTRIVREGGTADATTLLSPGMTMEQASSQIQNTTQLLASAEANLQKVSTRKLNMDQQAMVDQVHTYVQQAKDALNRGDLQRGHNLALKASLLADDLARH